MLNQNSADLGIPADSIGSETALDLKVAPENAKLKIEAYSNLFASAEPL